MFFYSYLQNNMKKTWLYQKRWFFTQNLAYSAAEIKKRLTCNHDKLVKHIYALALCPLTGAV